MNPIKLPLTFNALAIEQAGAPVTLHQKTVTSLGEGEVLVRVAYASINKMDPALARMNVFNLPQPYVLGFDFSGEVVAVGGPADGSFQPGAQVFGRTSAAGCFAEYVVAKRQDICLRGSIPAREAGAYGIAYLTAYESLVVTGDIQRHKGKTIYVAGAAGGVGHFAAQIAKAHGLKVIGTAGKAASLNLLHRMHLDHVIDYSKEDVVQTIMQITGGKGAKIVYDSTYAQSSYVQSAAVVAPGGEYIRLGTATQLARTGAEDMRAVVESRGASMTIADFGRYAVDPHYKTQVAKVLDGLKQAVHWYEEGKLSSVVTGTVPFDATALQIAFEAFLAGKNNVGKVVVSLGIDQHR